MENWILDAAGVLGDLGRTLGGGLLDGLQGGALDLDGSGGAPWAPDGLVQAEPPLPDAAPVAPAERESVPGPSGGDGLGVLDGVVPMAGAGGVVDATKLDPISLFMQADIIVKGVMVLLGLASVWCWAIIVDKMLRFRGLFRRADLFEDRFWSGGSLDDLYDRLGPNPRDPMTALFVAAMREWRRATARGDAGAALTARLPERIERVMHITISRELEDLERRLGFLASTGAVAPFVGLFGTVWGIMNSFHAIGMTKDTSLATVAPGIAEALFATAIGLVAAIPAVVAYNKLSNEVERYTRRLEGFAGEFSAILSRQIEERAAPSHASIGAP